MNIKGENNLSCTLFRRRSKEQGIALIREQRRHVSNAVFLEALNRNILSCQVRQQLFYRRRYLDNEIDKDSRLQQLP